MGSGKSKPGAPKQSSNHDESLLESIKSALEELGLKDTLNQKSYELAKIAYGGNNQYFDKGKTDVGNLISTQPFAFLQPKPDINWLKHYPSRYIPFERKNGYFIPDYFVKDELQSPDCLGIPRPLCLELLCALESTLNPLITTYIEDIFNVAVHCELSQEALTMIRIIVKLVPTPVRPPSPSTEPDKYIVFHHYTSMKSMLAIKKSQKIMKSTDDAKSVYGCGVYGTPLGPENGRKQIAENNYGQAWRFNENCGKVEAVFRLKISNNKKVKKIANINREIYLYDDDLEFKDAKEVDLIYYENNTKIVELLK